MGISVHSWNSIIMKAFIFATLLAVATAIPLEDTAEVKAAKEAFMAAFAAAEAGEHALPVPPVHTVTPVVNAPAAVAAPVLAAPGYYNGYYGHPYAHAGYAGYAAGHAAYYGHPYAHAGYA